MYIGCNLGYERIIDERIEIMGYVDEYWIIMNKSYGNTPLVYKRRIMYRSMYVCVLRGGSKLSMA